ncbi:MAG: PAS domain S-box protein [Dehalococcoidia bacterium]
MTIAQAREQRKITGFGGAAASLESDATGLFAEIFFRNPQPMLICQSPSLAIIEVNNACCTLTGFVRGELLRKSLADLVHPDDQASLRVAGAAAERRRYVGSDGRVVSADTRVETLNLDGRRANLVVMSGVTSGLAAAVPAPAEQLPPSREERRREETLARLAAMVDSSADAIVGCDMEGRIVSWNPGAERLYGWTAREALGQPLTITVPSEERVNSSDRLGRLMTGGAIREAKAERVTKDGRLVTVRLTDFPVRDSAGRLMGTAAIAHDITEEQKSAHALARAEVARREAEERLRAVVRHLPVSLSAIDADGMVTLAEGRPLASLGAAGAELGAAAGASLGQNINSVFPLGHPLVRAAARALQGEEVVDSITYRDQIFQFRMTPIRDNGRVTGAVCVASDMTEQFKAEHDALRTEKLESLVVLAGGVAHDFNNLLHVIMGNADLALMSLGPADEPVGPIGEIKVAARRAADLARQMLAYTGHGQASIEAIEIAPLVSETLDLLRVALPPGVEVVCDLAEGIPLVDGDPTQLRQVLMNLIINASEAIGTDQGEISVSAGLLDMRAGELEDQGYLPATPPPGIYAAIEVSDSGAGMDEATVARIFDPFFTTKFTGRGLGLAAVLGMVRGHGGAIRVDSEPANGTVFTVVLPVRPAVESS